MDSGGFLDSVESSMDTALDRLASSKSLIVLTDASLKRDRVLTVVAARERAAIDLFESWSDTDQAQVLVETIHEAAARHQDNLEAILELLDAPEPPAPTTEPMHTSMAAREQPIHRAAAMLGRALVEECVAKQVVGFFINEADPAATDLFREIRESHERSKEDALDLLEDLCDSEEQWEEALTTTTETVQTAYDHYVETLEGMGVNPKPVC